MRQLWARGRWVLLVALLAAAAAYGLSRLTEPQGRPALASAPADASLVVSVDAAALLRSTLWRALLDDRGDGARRIVRTCGYDPLDQVERVTVFVYGSDESPYEHIGFVARGEVARGGSQRRRLVGCVGRVLAEQGGATESIEVEGVPAMASARGRSVGAFLGDDSVVGGDREVVARAIRVHEAREPSAETSPELSSLWASVASRPHAVAVARLPERWVPALRRMAGGLPDAVDALAEVRALGVGARLEPRLELLGVLRVTPARAGPLAEAIRGRVEAALESPEARLSLVGAALRRVEVRAAQSEVRVTASLGDDLVEDLVSGWRDLSSLGDLDVDDVADGGLGGSLDGGAASGVVVDGGPGPVADPEPGDDAGGHEDRQEQ